MAKKSKATQSDVEPEQVRLSNLFGLPPKTWVPALYGVVLLVGLVVLFVVPGIRTPGAIVEIRSTPSGATVVVDGHRVGATPLAVFVPVGSRTIVLERPFFESLELPVQVPNRLIGSRFFPARVKVHQRLRLVDPIALRDTAASEFSSWAMIGAASAQYQFPWVLSEAIADLAADPDALRSMGPPLVESALGDLRSDALMRDFLRATTLNRSSGNAALPGHLLAVFGDLVTRVDQAPQLGVLLSHGLSGDLQAELRGSPWYEAAVEAQTTRILPFTTEGGPEFDSMGVVTVGGVPFRHIPGGTLVVGMGATTIGDSLDRPHLVEVEPFYIQQTPVTRAHFRAFLSHNPQWREQDRDRLVALGLASPDYLTSWGYLTGVGDDDRLPATEVSFHAAVAYTRWLSGALPAALAGYRARLPYEEEYEWAAVANGTEGYDAGFRRSEQDGPYPVGSFPGGQYQVYDLLGNVWQWTASWYRTGDYLVRSHPHSPYGRRNDPPAAEVSVRGGSWINSPQAVRVTTRGSQPPQWATPFLGFRPVLSRVE